MEANCPRGSSTNVRVIAVSVSAAVDTQAFFGDQAGEFEIITIADSRVLTRSFKIHQVPQVVFLTPSGTLNWLGTGILTEAQKTELLGQMQTSSSLARQ